MGQFATGLENPLSLVFDNQGNLYVGQQTTPYIAEYSPTGQRLPDIGPVQTELYGDDWIDLASDECTFYYTTEGTDILRYNKCTNTQESNFNQVPFSGPAAFEVRILQDGEVLVADSSAVLLLDQNGNVIQTYSCSSLPGCQGQLFAVAVDPSGTSFWTGRLELGRRVAGQHGDRGGHADDQHQRWVTSTGSPWTTSRWRPPPRRSRPPRPR